MNDFVQYVLTAVSLVFVIEGLLYALFPDMIRRFMAQAIAMPIARLRLFGFVMAASGFSFVWMMQYL